MPAARQLSLIEEPMALAEIAPDPGANYGEVFTRRWVVADTNKRVKELAFKSIDLKGEAARRLTMVGVSPTSGGAGGGDLSTWLHASRPRIYLFMAVRVVSDSDFNAVVRWAETAAQVVDAVGLYCYEPAGAGSPPIGDAAGFRPRTCSNASSTARVSSCRGSRSLLRRPYRTTCPQVLQPRRES
jgi:hypothetical protein